MTIESGLEKLGNDLVPTAYIVWALADAGFAGHRNRTGRATSRFE